VGDALNQPINCLVMELEGSSGANGHSHGSVQLLLSKDLSTNIVHILRYELGCSDYYQPNPH
jgi:hypothetical protein